MEVRGVPTWPTENSARDASILSAEVSCSSRRSLLILGDSLSDLDVGTGVDRDATYSVGLLNDLRPPWCDPDEYDARFTAVLRGDRASLDPVTDLLERAEAAAKSS